MLGSPRRELDALYADSGRLSIEPESDKFQLGRKANQIRRVAANFNKFLVQTTPSVEDWFEEEKWMAERINARKTITLPTSHASVATCPDDIVRLIEEASNAVVAKAGGFR